jgi:hypothetical protein
LACGKRSMLAPNQVACRVSVPPEHSESIQSMKIRPPLALTLAAALWLGMAPALVQAATISPQPGQAANASLLDLATYGMAEQEFFISGQANAYTEVGIWRKDGVWPVKVKKSAQPYKTRVLARYPKDAARFNGTVVVEWLNVTGGTDAEIDGSFMREELLAKGYAWVGVSAQKAGVEGIKKAYPGRYDSLSITNDALSYDIFSEVARALRQDGSPLLGGLKAARLLAAGQSQSALRLTTYVNAQHLREHVYDAYLIHSRGSFPAGIDSFLSGPLVAQIRTDIDVPVFQLQTEFDTGPAFGGKSRQSDSPKLRTWEVAGAAHIDEYALSAMNAAVPGVDASTVLKCSKPFNNLPFYRAEKAVLRHLQSWMIDGQEPPHAPPLATNANGSFKRDSVGNALGGVRLPEVEAPLNVYGISNSAKAGAGVNLLGTLGCSFVGSSTPLTSDQIKKLYASQADFLARYDQAAQAAVAAGYLLPEDAAVGLATATARAGQLPLP